MDWTVAVYDTDVARASAVCESLEQCGSPHRMQIHSFTDRSELNIMVAYEGADVLFCDVRADDYGIGGIDIAQEVLSANQYMQVVYTGVTEDTLASVQKHSYAYLLPSTASAEDIACAINKAIALRSKGLERPLLIRTRKFSRTVLPGHVSYIESDLRKIRIHVDDDVIETYGKLSGILKVFPRRFIQCHKSFVVNLGFVAELDHESLTLTTGVKIPISQKRRKKTREAFASYVGRAL